MIRVCLDSPKKDHPPITPFLGVSVRSHASVFGNFALTGRLDAAASTAEVTLQRPAVARGESLTINEGDEKGLRLLWAIPIG